MATVKKIKAAIRKPRRVGCAPTKETDWLSTGSTLVNLALSGHPMRGVPKGKYVFFVGDSSSGKTFFTLTMLAEAGINPNFDDYRFIYNNVEGGAMMDLNTYFGPAVAERLEEHHSDTIDEFYTHLDECLDDDRPCIYILDSQDALSSAYEKSKFDDRKREVRGGPKAKGDYGDGKAKRHSSGIRQALPRLRDTGSILILVCQTRDNIDAGLFEQKKIYSGGRAIRFYATVQLWTSIAARLTKQVKGKPRQVGITAKVAVKKNRLTGKEWVVEIPLYWSIGIDDIGSCVDYLVAEGRWKKSKVGVIKVPEFVIEAKREGLIKFIEEDPCKVDQVRTYVRDVWADLEERCKVERKGRYGQE